MRLTLRTLLAHLDGQIGGEAGRELDRRVRASQGAMAVVEAVQATRRGDAGELASEQLDPNDVAEYLEDLAPPMRVVRIEETCLGDRGALAEVAACHQILSQVINLQARPALSNGDRLRVLERCVQSQFIANPLMVPRGAETAPDATAGSEPVADEATRYKAPRRWMVGVAASVVGLVLASSVAFAYFQDWSGLRTPVATTNPRVVDPLQGSFKNANADEIANANENSRPDHLLAVSPVARTEPPATDGPGEPAMDPVLASDRAASASEMALPMKIPPEPLESAVGRSALSSRPAFAIGGANPPVPSSPFGRSLSPTDKEIGLAAGPGLATGVTGSTDTTPDVVASSNVTRVDDDREPRPYPMRHPAPRRTPREPIGRYGPERQALPLSWDASADGWNRGEANGVFFSGEPSLGVVGWQPTISLTNGPQVRCAGFSRIEGLPPDAAGAIGLYIDFGTVQIASSRRCCLRLIVDDEEYRLWFGPARNLVVLQGDPPCLTGRRNVRLEGIVVRGTVRCEAVGGEAIGGAAVEEFSSGRGFWIGAGRIVATPAPPTQWQSTATPPSWIAMPSERLREQLTDAEPAVVERLEEIAAGDADERHFAALVLVYLGHPRAAIAGLNSPDHELYWSEYLAALRLTTWQSQEVSQRVLAVLLEHHGDAAHPLRALLEIDRETTDSARIESMIRLLAHEELIFRVLAFDHLRILTGKTFLYRPTLEGERNVGRVAQWDEALKENRLSWRTPDEDS